MMITQPPSRTPSPMRMCASELIPAPAAMETPCPISMSPWPPVTRCERRGYESRLKSSPMAIRPRFCTMGTPRTLGRRPRHVTERRRTGASACAAARESRWTARWRGDGAEGSCMVKARLLPQRRAFDPQRPGPWIASFRLPDEAVVALAMLETRLQQEVQARLVLGGRKERSDQALRASIASALDGGPHHRFLHLAPQHATAEHAVDQGGRGSAPLEAED